MWEMHIGSMVPSGTLALDYFLLACGLFSLSPSWSRMTTKDLGRRTEIRRWERGPFPAAAFLQTSEVSWLVLPPASGLRSFILMPTLGSRGPLKGGLNEKHPSIDAHI